MLCLAGILLDVSPSVAQLSGDKPNCSQVVGGDVFPTFHDYFFATEKEKVGKTGKLAMT